MSLAERRNMQSESSVSEVMLWTNAQVQQDSFNNSHKPANMRFYSPAAKMHLTLRLVLGPFQLPSTNILNTGICHVPEKVIYLAK